MASEAQSMTGSASLRKLDWWKVGDGVVLLAYAAVVLWTLRYHEKWADEAQAWLIARDLDLRTIWFHELRYEGSPGLWHTILWVAQHVFHAGYGSIGYIGAAFAIAGAAVLLFCAPFPHHVRWPLAFTYVMVYQYAVIARPYTLLPLLAFCAAISFKDKRHPEKITTVLIILSMLTLHGAILAACLGAAYSLEVLGERKIIDKRLLTKYVVCIIAIACTFLFLFVILKPTPDVEEFALKQELARLPELVKAQQPDWSVKLSSIVSGAFLDFEVPSISFVLLVGVWCATRRKLFVFAVPVVLLIALYVAVHGYAHHHGTVAIAALAAVWIAWPTPDEVATLPRSQLRALHGMVIGLMLFCVVNLWDSAVVIKHEYLYPYSGAQDATNFLQLNGADQHPMFGLLYGIVGIQAYYDHNVFANVHAAYFHHGIPLEGTALDLEEVRRVQPDYIVAFSEQPQLMIDSGAMNELGPLGYEMAHFSDGYLLYKGGVYVRQAYFIFRRKDSSAHGSLSYPTHRDRDTQ